MGKQVNVRMSKSGSLLGLLGIGIRMEGDERMRAGRGNNIGKQALHDTTSQSFVRILSTLSPTH